MLSSTWGLLLASGLLSTALSIGGTDSVSKVPTATLLPKGNGDSKTIFVGRPIPEFDQEVFLGIKYADQPVRFKPSELKTQYGSNDSNSGPFNLTKTKSNSILYNATQYGYECPAYGSDTTKLVNMGLIELNEDCLNLNIIRPKSENGNGAQELLPVMLWIFGGGWQQGATADPRYFRLLRIRDCGRFLTYRFISGTT